MTNRPRYPSRDRRTLRAALALIVGAVVTACSLLIKPEQCTGDNDCGALGASYAGTVCRSGACVPGGSVADAGSDAAPACAVNADCASTGNHAICRASDHQCVSLLSQDCIKIVGDWSNDNAIYVGLLLKLISADDAGLDLGANPDMQSAVELAFNEFAHQVVGLPGGKGGKPRPLVLVECDHTFDAVRAAAYLADTVKVPAIIGAYTSGVAISVLTNVTVPDGVLFISPSATSAALTTLATDNLFWRTIPSDALQGRVHSLVLPGLEAQVNAERGTTSIRVAMVDKGDAYGTGLRDVMTSTMTFNGKSAAANQSEGRFLLRNYPDTDDPKNANYDFSTIATEVAQFDPDIAVLFGTDEIAKVFAGIESAWPAGKPRPYYLFSDGALVQNFYDAVEARRGDGGADDPRRRIRGTYGATPSGSVFSSFQLRLASASPESDPYAGAANAYDAAYAVAYGLAAIGNQPLTGANLALAFRKLVPPGTPYDVGPNNISPVLQALQAGVGIDLRGASGSLDFNTATGDVTTDIDVWCLAPNASLTTSFSPSGQTYSATGDTLVGQFNQGNVCQF
jgi:branched-chain amino acid transport system substrate-binding protein